MTRPGDRDPAAERGARRGGGEAADGEREQHDADRDPGGDAAEVARAVVADDADSR